MAKPPNLAEPSKDASRVRFGTPGSNPNIDRIKQRAGGRKAALSAIRSILAQYQQGRAASSCMDEIEKTIRSCDRGLNRQEGGR